jgi:serine/threonine protein kinase
MTPTASTICPTCRTPNQEDSNFCARCGTSLRSSGGASQAWKSSTSRAVDASAQTSPSVPSLSGSSGALAEHSEPERDIWLGRLIDARYRVQSRLGQGGMGIVYKVEHQRMGKIAAMKVLHRELASDKEVVRRFRREAEAISKLTHPNTVQVFDFGTSDGAMYLVMEYVRGEDLGAVLRRDGPLPFLRAAHLFIQIAGALSEAHELGIVHRDLKPENILVTRTRDGSEHIKVLDFGLAKLSERDEAMDSTGRGAIVGTPYYMSPEQIRGEPLDHRSDLYSLGAMLYRVITGEPPFTAQTPVGVLTKHLTDELVPPRVRRPDLDIDARVEAIVLRAMAKKREARYATVDSMREDLVRAAEELGAFEPGKRPSRGNLAVRARDSVGPSLTPTNLTTVDTAERDKKTSSARERLRREDFDAFERSLRRRTAIRVAVVPLLFVAAAGSAWYAYSWRQGQPRDYEREPNNSIDKATLIALDQPSTGILGSRLSDSEGDRDYFRVVLPGSEQPRKLRAHLAGIRNMDLVLVVLDSGGQRLGAVDNGGVGEDEELSGLAIDPSRDAVVVAVQENREGGPAIPTENVTDEYTLTVSVGPFAADEEREPNEADSEAAPIEVGQEHRGSLGRWRDVDKWRFAGPAGKYVIELDGDVGLPPVRLRAGAGAAQATRRLEATLAPGALVAVERDDPEATLAERKPVAGAGVAYRLKITPAAKK